MSPAPAIAPAETWATGAMSERLALLFDDGGVLVAEADGSIDGQTVATLRADLPRSGRLGRVRLLVLEVEPRPDPAVELPRDAIAILRQVRDTPAIGERMRAEIDRVLAGVAS